MSSTPPKTNDILVDMSTQDLRTETETEIKEQTKSNKNQKMQRNGKCSTLIIGSSLIQDIQTRRLKPEVYVRTNRGARLPTIRNRLQAMDLRGVENVIVQAGGNDVDSGKGIPARDIEAIENDFAEIINDVKQRSPRANVYLSTVLPRANVDVSEVNDTIQFVAREYGAIVIPCNEKIYDIESDLYGSDRLHLSKKGTSVLVKMYNSYVPILKSAGNTMHTTKSDWCYFCGEEGHISRNCRHGNEVKCWSCGHLGHKQKYCSLYH